MQLLSDNRWVSFKQKNRAGFFGLFWGYPLLLLQNCSCTEPTLPRWRSGRTLHPCFPVMFKAMPHE